jgi:hypothetical protein
MYRKIETWYLRHNVGVEVVFIVLCVLALLVDIACLCGLWKNHPGNVVSLFTLTGFIILSSVHLWNWRHGDGEGAP